MWPRHHTHVLPCVLTDWLHEIARYRGALGVTARIWADVAVKHSALLGDRFLGDEVEDTVERALADAVIVSGKSTRKPRR
jgi:uncharacterized protein